MFDRFEKVSDHIRSNVNQIGLLKNRDTNNIYLLLFIKHKYKNICEYQVFRNNSDNSKYVSVNIDILKQKVWFSLDINDTNLNIECISDKPEEYREQINVNLDQPLLVWYDTKVPDIYNFV